MKVPESRKPSQAIAVVSFSNLERDPRVYRQISMLARQYRVTAYGLADPKIDGVEFRDLASLWLSVRVGFKLGREGVGKTIHGQWKRGFPALNSMTAGTTTNAVQPRPRGLRSNIWSVLTRRRDLLKAAKNLTKLALLKTLVLTKGRNLLNVVKNLMKHALRTTSVLRKGRNLLKMVKKVTKFALLTTVYFRDHFFAFFSMRSVLETAWRRIPLQGDCRECIRSMLSHDLVLLNDFTGLLLVPAMRRLSAKKSIVYDAHEYTPGQFPDTPEFSREQKFTRSILQMNLKRVQGVITVCDGIADLYREEFGIQRPSVILNAPFYREGEASVPTRTGPIRFVHHGVAAPMRQLELMIDAIMLAGAGFELHFYLVSSKPDYYETLLARGRAVGNVHFHEPVAMTELTSILTAYDAGIYLLPPTNLNNKLALPNKLFEFVQSRLPVAIGPSPEMARVVVEHNIGIVSSDFTPAEMARTIEKFNREIIADFRSRTDAAAQILSGERQGEILTKVVADVLEA